MSERPVQIVVLMPASQAEHIYVLTDAGRIYKRFRHHAIVDELEEGLPEWTEVLGPWMDPERLDGNDDPV